MFLLSPRNAKDSWWSIIVTSLALQLSALATLSTISLYHAVYITILGLPAFAISVTYIPIYGDELGTAARLASLAHGISWPVFGLWTYATAQRFPCYEGVKLWLFAERWAVVGGLRIFVMVVHSVVLLGVIVLLGRALRRFRRSGRPSPQSASVDPVEILCCTAIQTAALVLSIASGEFLVHDNNVQREEMRWSYGQVSAMVLLLAPAGTLVKVIRAEMRSNNHKRALEDRPIAWAMASIWERRQKRANRREVPMQEA